MSEIHQILELARQQSAALASGDLERAVQLLDARAPLVERVGRVAPADAELISEILQRDRQLSGAIRERMIDLRNRAVKTQHGRQVLAGYRTGMADASLLVDTSR